MESKPNFAKVHGPWWTQIKVVLIQKGVLDNQNPGFCMGWPGLYLLDSIVHSRSALATSSTFSTTGSTLSTISLTLSTVFANFSTIL